MGGEIGVTSREGEASTFWFEVTLPVATKSTEPKPRYSPRTALSSLEILVVDDVEINRTLLNILLQGHEIETAESGEEALRKTGAQNYDIILMDIQMPGMARTCRHTGDGCERRNDTHHRAHGARTSRAFGSLCGRWYR